ncbi:MAG: four helix bundle protein [Thermoanaerobaculia bacterium]
MDVLSSSAGSSGSSGSSSVPRSYRELRVWQEAMELAVRVYAVTAEFPAQERYGIVQQMRRAVVSIPSNIAEGYGRRTAKQRYNFLENALGSVFELETQIELAARLRFIHEDEFRALADTIRGIGRGLMALMRYVQNEARTEKNRYT